ncbi:LysM peptidoglycan-binding domain-containing protein, partial [Eubacteriales bacterium OttesenSCG-928-A19]|nr:LysM peptidoglycan-binding domain-containing protein [Eubacteriales bacterium OttesenSCG-928-A19]
GTANNFCVAFEICEPKGHKYAGGGTMVNYDPVKNEAYFRAIWKNAIELCAMLCVKFKIDPMNIIGHYEGARKGIASNHADPGQWLPRHGESMDTFRAAVKQRLAVGNIGILEPDPEEQPSDPLIPDIPIGTIMMFRPDAKRYYPGGTTIPGWVKDEFYHVITAVDNGGKAMIRGEKVCVLLGRRMKKKGGKEETGIRTWTDLDVLVKVADPGGVPQEPDPGEPEPGDPDPPDPEPADDYFMYTVQQNDTLWGIAREHLGAGALYKQIMELNGLKNDVIREGQALKIPK